MHTFEWLVKQQNEELEEIFKQISLNKADSNQIFEHYFGSDQ